MSIAHGRVVNPSRSSPAPERVITRWDIDKTYLRSRFDTLRELLSAAIERPEQKRSVPGAAAVLRELSERGARVSILSGSPRQLRRKLSAKLALDGVRYDELTLKPNLSNLARLRFRALRDQLGYKLPELLQARARDAETELPPAREILVGDDSESDAFVYSLYADVCEGVVTELELERILEVGEAYGGAVRSCKRALARIPRKAVVDRILIHLDGQTPPSRFRLYGSRLIPFYNYFQAACVLLERGVLPPAAVLRIAAEFIELHGFSPDSIARSYLDLSRRKHAEATAPAALQAALSAFEAARSPVSELTRAVAMMKEDTPAAGPQAPARPPVLDYITLAERYRGGRNRRRPGMTFG